MSSDARSRSPIHPSSAPDGNHSLAPPPAAGPFGRARPALRIAAATVEPVAADDFYDGEIAGVTIRALQVFADRRGWLAELFRNDELPEGLFPAMAYVSETRPGIVRGPHEHVRQTDYFAFLGPGDFELFLWDARPSSPTRFARLREICGQSRPCVAIIPPGVVHAYRNVSSVDGWVFNAPNQLYAGRGKRDPVDEIRHEDDPDSPYRIDGASFEDTRAKATP